MDNAKFFEELFDPKILKIMRLFFSNREKRYYLREVSQITEVPLATTFRIVHKLTRLGVLKQLNISRFKLYKLDSNEKTDLLEPLVKEEIRVAEKFVDLVKEVPGISRIILHGKETENKANLLVIGQNIDSEELKKMAAVVKDNYDFNITYLTLTEEQYEQMSSMGLYSGEKKTLFET